MLERKLLKALLEKDFYLKNKSRILETMFPQELRGLYETICQAYEKYSIERLSIEELSEIYFSLHPAITVAGKSNMEIILTDLQNEKELNREIAQDLLQAVSIREVARQIGKEALDVLNGDTPDLGKLVGCFQRFDGIDILASDSTVNILPTASDLESIIEGIRNNIQWFFNLSTVRQVCPGIGPALFGIIAMRPEAGKTALYTHMVAGPEGFAWQGAKVDVICNEEPAIRTKMRCISAATGMTEAEIINDVERARPIWEAIRDNVRIFDAVGMSMQELDAHVKRSRPDILIVDQLDKVTSILDREARTDEKLRDVYTGFREVLKRNQIAGIGISQLSADAHDRLNVDFSTLENSKTGKAAEADLIICGGAKDGTLRQLNFCKNKISGNHGAVVVYIEPHISRYRI